MGFLLVNLELCQGAGCMFEAVEEFFGEPGAPFGGVHVVLDAARPEIRVGVAVDLDLLHQEAFVSLVHVLLLETALL